MKCAKLLLLVSFCFFFSRPISAQTPEHAVSTASVMLSGDTVLVLRSRLLSLSAQERAQRVSERIKKLAMNRFAEIDKITVTEGESTSDIALDDYVIMSVTDKDAKVAGVTRQELAVANAALIKDAVHRYRKTYNMKSLGLGLFFALLSTAFFVFLFKGITKAYLAASAKMKSWAPTAVKGIKLQQFELLPAEDVISFLEGILKAVRVLLSLLLLYIFLPILFSFFPWTKGYADKLFGYVLHPVASLLKSFFGYIPDLIFVGITVTCVHYFLKLIGTIAREVQRERISFAGFYPDWAMPTFQIFRFVSWAFSLVIIFPYLPGSDSPAFKGVSVFLGVLFSLGSTSAIANAVAGIILTYMRPFKLGDRVKIVDTVGDVIEKGLLVTRVKTIKNVYITVPNAMVLGSHIINYSSLSDNEGLILNTSVTIGYDVPWQKVHELMISAAKASEGVLPEPAPFVLQTALNDYNVAYELNAYTDKPEIMAKIYSSMHQNMQDKFAEAGVEILSPAFASLRDGNAAMLPVPPKAPSGAAFKVRVSGESPA